MATQITESEEAFKKLCLGFNKIKATTQLNSKEFDQIKLILEVIVTHLLFMTVVSRLNQHGKD